MGTLLMFPPKVHFDDDDGNDLSGGKVFTYIKGTTTPKDTYTDKAKTTPHANPVILDSRGEAEIWLDGEYKIVVKDSNDVEVYTVDDVSTETVTGADTDAEWFSPGLEPTYISATSFSVEDDQTAIFHEGRRVRCTVTAGIVYGVIQTVVFSSLTTVTVVLDAGALDSGLSVADVGTLSAQNQAYPIQQIQYGGYAYIPDTGAADAYVAVMVPPLYEYKTGFQCKVLMANANTTINPTININGLGVKVVKRQTGVALVANDIVANQIVDLIYDGTDFILLNKSVIDEHAHTNPSNGGLISYPLYGDGEDGAFSSGATGNLPGGLFYHSTYIINDTHVMTVNTGQGIIVIADTAITIEGTLSVSGLGEVGGVATTAETGKNGTNSSVGSGSGGGGGGGSGFTGGSGGDSVANYVTVSGGAGGGSGSDGSVGGVHTETNTYEHPYFQRRTGGGGGSGGNTAFAGGDGGGFIILIAPAITIEATAILDVSGSAGGNGNLGNSGGSGGGGGGLILMITPNYTDNGGTFTLSGGAGGTKVGTGGDGAAGGAGLKRVMEL